MNVPVAYSNGPIRTSFASECGECSGVFRCFSSHTHDGNGGRIRSESSSAVRHVKPWSDVGLQPIFTLFGCFPHGVYSVGNKLNSGAQRQYGTHRYGQLQRR